MGFMNEIFRMMLESASGKINTSRGLWKFVTDKDILPQEAREAMQKGEKYHWMDETFHSLSYDSEGKPVILANIKAASNCTNTAFQGIYPHLRDHYYTPYSICRKCEFHKSARESKRRYATCKLLAENNPEKAAVEEFTSILKKSVDETNKLLK